MARNFLDINSIPEKEVEVVSAHVENLMKFCKPVYLYTILQDRSKMNPTFLPRCLNYKIKAKRQNKSTSSGRVVFNYMDSTNKILETELVKNFTCPFCEMPCGCLKGIHHHLLSSHERFDYKFWQAELDHPKVDVSVKPDALKFREQGNANVKKNKRIPFSFCIEHRKISQKVAGKNMKRLNVKFLELLDSDDVPRLTENEMSNVNDGNNMEQPNVDSMEVDFRDSLRVTENELANVKNSNMKRPNVDSMEFDLNELPRDTENEVSNVNGGTISPEKISEIQTTNEHEIGQSSKPKKAPHVTRRKQLAAERDDPETRRDTRLQSRQFYHSQTYQPMSVAEVMAEADSEGEPENDSADLNERLWLTQLENVSDGEKKFMHLWNIFVRKERVFAYGQVAWACEEFTKRNEKELNGSQPFFWWWKHFQINLWNRCLILADTINNCSTILENAKAGPGPSTSQDSANGN